MKLSGNTTGGFFDRNDFFSSNIPAFTIEGQEQLGTSLGFAGSIVQTVIIVCFFSLKMFFMFDGRDLIVTQGVHLDMYELHEKLDLEENELNFAFMVENSNDKQPKDDPNFVEWHPKLITSNGVVDTEVTML
jgi:hypothetical protein